MRRPTLSDLRPVGEMAMPLWEGDGKGPVLTAPYSPPKAQIRQARRMSGALESES